MTKQIKKYDFKTGLPQEFEILDLSILYTNAKPILTNPHRSGFYHIIWFQDCSVTHLVDFNPIKIKPHSLLFLNKDIVHRFDNKEQLKGKVILFTDTFFCKTEADTRFLQKSVLFHDLLSVSQIQIENQSELFMSVLQLMTTELQSITDDLQAAILQNLLHNFLLLSEREIRNQKVTTIKKGADLDDVMLFRAVLEANYKNQKQVHFYAKQLIITQKRLNQATTKVLGKSPKELIDERVVLEAKRILAHTTESVKEIAYHLGFEEPTNFIKFFKKHATVTPTEFREHNAMA